MPNHLIHIGFPKTGSTFLQEWFSLHPQMHYAPGAIGGFYNVYEICRLAADPKNSEIKYFVTSNEELSVPSFNTGTNINNSKQNLAELISTDRAQESVCAMLKALFPNGKILLVTRGFKGIIISGYSEYIKHGGTLSIKEFTTVSFNEDGGGLNYSFLIDLYEASFGKENVIVLPYEMLRDNQVQFLSVVEQRLKIPHIELAVGRINESLSSLEMYWYPRMSSLVSEYSLPLGKKISKLIVNKYIKKLLHSKFKKTVKLLDRIKPGRTFNPSDISPVLIAYYRKKNNEGICAARLRDNPLYLTYLSEYLLD